MWRFCGKSGPIFARGPRDPLHQFIAVGLHQHGLAFCLLLVVYHIHRNLFACFFIAHLEDLQNQTIICDNYSTIRCFRVSIITTRQRICLSAFQACWTFSSREDPAVREHETCQTDHQKKFCCHPHSIYPKERDMEYKRLGYSGLKVSRIILGCMGFGDPSRGTQEWALGIDEARPLIKQALEAGITTFDTANVYSLGASEEIVGNVMGELTRRDDVIILHIPPDKLQRFCASKG
jgi:hypothetical protein